MRIFIIIDDDRFFVPDMLYHLINNLDGDIVGIGMAKKKYTSLQKFIISMWQKFQKKRIIFGYQGLFVLFLKLLIRDIKYLFLGKVHSTKELAKKFNIKYQDLFDINSIASIKLLKGYNIDLIISIQDQIFKKDLINLPQIGCINKHAALLPKYRGVWPIFWAMLNGEKEVGLTIHWINEGIDTGKIITQKYITINRNDTLFNLYEEVFTGLSGALIEAIKKIKKDPRCGIAQTAIGKNYFSFPKQEDIDKFKKLGKRIL